jgi:hypothetical protein
VFFKDDWETIIVYRNEINKFLNSSQVIVAGSINPNPWEGWFCAEDCEEGSRLLYIKGFLLHTLQSNDSAKNNVLFFRDKAIDYPSNTFVVENVKTGHPRAFYVKADGSISEKKIYFYEKPKKLFHGPSVDGEKERVFISEYEIRVFVKSPQTVSLGSRFFDSSGLVYNPFEGELTPRLILRFQPSSDPDKNNVLFFKGKAVDYKPNTYVVEDVQSEYPKAFYVEEDGAKRELVLRLL